MQNTKEIDLEHLTIIVERGEGNEEYIYLEGEWYSAQEYLELMGFEINAWLEV